MHGETEFKIFVFIFIKGDAQTGGTLAYRQVFCEQSTILFVLDACSFSLSYLLQPTKKIKILTLYTPSVLSYVGVAIYW